MFRITLKKITIAIFILSVCINFSMALESGSGLYIKNKSKNIHIVKVAIDVKSSTRIQDAAKQAVRILEKISGKKITLTTVAEMPTAPAGTLFIGNIIGQDKDISDKLQGIRCGYIVNLDKSSIQIVGTNPYYSYMGVFRFFQHLGAEFYVRADTLERYYPKRKDIVENLPDEKALEVASGWIEKPRFFNIDSGGRGIYTAKITGISRSAASSTHGLERMLVPYKKYGKQHPEFYSPTKHLCLSNPEVQKIAKQNIVKWMDKHPEAVYFNVGHADAPKWCECENCKKMGVSNERYMKFVNLLAAEAIKKHPDKKIVAIAYTPFTEAPPENFKPAENIIVLFCPYFWGGAHSQSHSLSEPINQTAFKHFKEWSKILKPGHMICFEYVRPYQFELYPDVMLNATAANIKLYAGYPQVDSMVFCGWPYNSMADLSYYVIDQLLWNPQLNTDKLISNFMKAYYGKAAPYMKQYYDLVQSTIKTKPHNQPAPYYAPGLLETGLAEKAYPIFQKAENAVKDNKVYLNRVLLEKDYLLYVDLFERNPANGRETDMSVFAPKLQEFIKIMVEVVAPDKTSKRGGGSFGKWGNRNRGQLPPDQWLTQVSGMKIDGKDLYNSKVIKDFIKSTDPASFIRQHSTEVRPAPAGTKIALSQGNTFGKIWINNPYKAVLRLVAQGSGKLTIKFNGRTVYQGTPVFGKEHRAQNIKISTQLQKLGWNEINFIYDKKSPNNVSIEEASLLY